MFLHNFIDSFQLDFRFEIRFLELRAKEGSVLNHCFLLFFSLLFVTARNHIYSILKDVVFLLRAELFIMIVDILYKCFVNKKIIKFAILLLLLCRPFFVIKFHVVLIFIKLFIPFFIKLGSTHEMAIDNAYVFSI